MRSVIHGICLFALAGSSPAAADTTDEIWEMSLEELLEVRITVASLFEEERGEVGSTVGYVDRSEWSSRSSKKTVDALEHFPGIHVTNQLGADLATFRGYQFNNGFKAVAVQLDGIPVNDYSFNTHTRGFPNYGELGAYESIELIRGPMSTLYGTDAFHGVIALNPAEPDRKRLDVEVGGGSFAYLRGAAATTVALPSDFRLILNAAGSTQDDEKRAYTYTDTNSGALADSQYRFHHESSLLTAKLARGKTSLAGYWNRFRGEGVGPFVEFPGVSDNGSQVDRRADLYAGQLRHTEPILRHHRLDFRASHWKQESGAHFGLDPGPVERFNILEIDETRTDFDVRFLHESTESPLKYLVGYSFSRFDTKDVKTGPSAMPIDELYAHKRRDVHSLIVQADRRFDRIKVVAGGRWDDYSDAEDHFSPRLGLIANPASGSTVKLLYGHGFRAPGASEVYGVLGFIGPGGTSLKPETIDTFEIIVQQQTDRIEGTVNAFWSILENGIAAGNLVFANITESESKGVEAEGIFRSGPWEVSASGSWVEAKQTAPTEEDTIFHSFPPWMLHYGLRWKGESSNVDLGLFNHHRWGARTITNPSAEVKDYFRTDLTVEWHARGRDGGLRLFANLRNLLDRENFISLGTPHETGLIDASFNFVGGIRYSL